MHITDPELKRLIQLAMVPSKEVLKLVQGGVEEELSSCFTNMANHAYEYALTARSQQDETTTGTVFGAYNAVTGYYQNVRNFKDEEAKLKSLMFGGTAQTRSQQAFQLCDDFARTGRAALFLN